MSTPRTVAVTFSMTRVCKNVVRYDAIADTAPGATPAVENIYVSKLALGQLADGTDYPEMIHVQISAGVPHA